MYALFENLETVVLFGGYMLGSAAATFKSICELRDADDAPLVGFRQSALALSHGFGRGYHPRGAYQLRTLLRTPWCVNVHFGIRCVTRTIAVRSSHWAIFKRSRTWIITVCAMVLGVV